MIASLEPGRPLRGHGPGRGGRRAGPRARADRGGWSTAPRRRSTGGTLADALPARPSPTATALPAATPYKPAAAWSGCAATWLPTARRQGRGYGAPRAHGPARVFEEEACIAAVRGGDRQPGRRAGHPQRGPGRRPGHAGDAERHRGGRRRRARRVGDARDRRPVLGRHARADGGPRRARGGRAAVRWRSSPRARRSRSTSTRGALTSTSTTPRSRGGSPPGAPPPARRRRRARAVPRRVGSASEGAALLTALDHVQPASMDQGCAVHDRLSSAASQSTSRATSAG